ncbi:hypothetical protein Lepto1489_14790 [Leptospira interrogans serovar Bataviae]|uniref:Uncharacterized protein n=1 Tax=Leptospira interrogans serovar Bataviae TaxID=312175 RepID=A0AAP9WN16_LEPIR|nr:hypothetical protein Lepto1489_14790 [Leptospira interrogans serovar Bataviae]
MLIASCFRSFSNLYTDIVQITFLLSKVLEKSIQNSLFNFSSDSWGLHCNDIFYILQELEKQKLIETIEGSNGLYKTFHITKLGYSTTSKKLKLISRYERNSIKKLSSVINDFTYLKMIAYIKLNFPERGNNIQV